MDKYQVTSPPEFAESPLLYAYKEFRKIMNVLGDLVDFSGGEFTEAPKKPRIGKVVYARAPWNPGGGEGFYGYSPTGWIKLA